MMMNQRLWEQSGHWEHYKENMYFSEADHQRFALKPMNCPGHMLLFKESFVLIVIFRFGWLSSVRCTVTNSAGRLMACSASDLFARMTHTFL